MTPHQLFSTHHVFGSLWVSSIFVDRLSDAILRSVENQVGMRESLDSHPIGILADALHLKSSSSSSSSFSVGVTFAWGELSLG